jgi:hypothetical protein
VIHDPLLTKVKLKLQLEHYFDFLLNRAYMYQFIYFWFMVLWFDPVIVTDLDY